MAIGGVGADEAGADGGEGGEIEEPQADQVPDGFPIGGAGLLLAGAEGRGGTTEEAGAEETAAEDAALQSDQPP